MLPFIQHPTLQFSINLSSPFSQIQTEVPLCYYWLSSSTFAVALDISKAFDRVWHKSLLSKLPSYGFYPSLCVFISSFLSGRSISAVVDCYCSKLKSINSGVPQGSVLTPTLFLLFINDLLSITDCPIQSYADDSTLHCSITFKSRPSQTELHNARLDDTESLLLFPIGAEGT